MERTDASGSMPAGLKFCRQVLHPLLAATALVCLLAWVGWTGVVETWQHWLTVGIGLAFAIERAWIFRVMKPRGRERARLWMHLVLALLVAAVAFTLIF